MRKSPRERPKRGPRLFRNRLLISRGEAAAAQCQVFQPLVTPFLTRAPPRMDSLFSKLLYIPTPSHSTASRQRENLRLLHHRPGSPTGITIFSKTLIQVFSGWRPTAVVRKIPRWSVRRI